MEPFAAVEEKLKAFDRFVTEWDQWRGVLARDALWTNRESQVAEPARSQIADFAEALASADEGMRILREATAETREGIADGRRLLGAGMLDLPAAEVQEVRLLKELDRVLLTAPQLISGVSGIVNELRRAQGLPPFEPGEDENRLRLN